MVDGFGWIGLVGFGALAGAIARLALRNRVPVTWAETVLIGIIGAGVGTTAQALATGQNALQLSLVGAITGIGTSILVLASYAAVRSKFTPATEHTSVEALLLAGETDHVEFKEAARHNKHTDERDARLETAVTKTVAGFLNARGGTLLIGVTDNGEVLGLEQDLQHMKHPDLDRYQLWLSDLLDTTALSSITIDFPEINSHQIARLKASRHPEPVYARPSGGQPQVNFYLRTGNSTRQLLLDEAVTYITNRQSRWRRTTSGDWGLT